MNRSNRNEQDDEYGIAGWYNATRDSTCTSVMSEDPNILSHQKVQAYLQPQRVEMRTVNPQMRPMHQHNYHHLHPVQQSNAQQYQRQQREVIEPVGFYAESNESMVYSPQSHDHDYTGFRQEYYGNYPQHQYAHQKTNRMRPRDDSSVIILDDLPRGVVSAARDEPPLYQTRTHNMGDPVYPMGVGYGGGMYSKPSQQDLLSDHRKYDTKNEMAAIELSKGSAVYNPPEPPSASTTQYSANSQLSRDKSVKDRYKQRKAGGDSGMGECCEPCCGGCMQCVCCSCCSCCAACGCIGPLLAWALLVAVLVGTALGIYFNWDKIRDAISHTGNSTAPSDTQSAAIAAPTATAAPPAARDLLHLAGSLVSPLVENDVLPALL